MSLLLCNLKGLSLKISSLCLQLETGKHSTPSISFLAQTIYGKGVPVSYDSLSSNAVALSSLGKNSILTLLVISQYRMTIEITDLKKKTGSSIYPWKMLLADSGGGHLARPQTMWGRVHETVRKT